MLKSALAGAIALATIGTTLSFAQDYQLQSYPQERTASTNEAVDSKIAQFRAALHLTSDQQRHWPRVEAVLRDVVARAQVKEASAESGYIQRVTSRVGSAVLSANAVRRLVAAASPLVKSLDPNQKQVAIALARDMGFGAVAAQFE
jgi:hypothetical protein